MKEYIVKYETEQIENSTFFYGGKIKHELIRCKDCRWWKPLHGKKNGGCDMFKSAGIQCSTTAEFFCAMATPKEKET